MTEVLKHSRRDLRERAFQALFSLEFGGEVVAAAEYAYRYDKSETVEDNVPLFLLDLVNGVYGHRDELDQEISRHLKSGWSVERLTLTDKELLRLGLFEITYSQTPNRVVVNEIVEIAKKYADTTAAKFINGILTKFVTED